MHVLTCTKWLTEDSRLQARRKQHESGAAQAHMRNEFATLVGVVAKLFRRLVLFCTQARMRNEFCYFSQRVHGCKIIRARVYYSF